MESCWRLDPVSGWAGIVLKSAFASGEPQQAFGLFLGGNSNTEESSKCVFVTVQQPSRRLGFDDLLEVGYDTIQIHLAVFHNYPPAE